MRSRGVLLVVVLPLLLVLPLGAQDPVEVDPKHHKVEIENEQVWVLRVSFGSHEKSVMHEHPAGVVVMLADHRVKFTFPDGSTVARQPKAGGVVATGANETPL